MSCERSLAKELFCAFWVTQRGRYVLYVLRITDEMIALTFRNLNSTFFSHLRYKFVQLIVEVVLLSLQLVCPHVSQQTLLKICYHLSLTLQQTRFLVEP